MPLYDVDSLSRCMAALANDTELRADMSKAARQRAAGLFDETHLASDFAPIYETLAEGRPATGHVTVRPEA